MRVKTGLTISSLFVVGTLAATGGVLPARAHSAQQRLVAEPVALGRDSTARIPPVTAGGKGRADSSKSIRWVKTLAEAQATAKRSGRLVLIDLYADWCVYCHMLDTKIFPVPAVERAVSQYVPVRLDSETSGAPLLERYDPQGALPYLVILDPDGNQIDEIPGVEGAGDFADDLNRIAAGFKEFPKLELHVKDDPADIDSAVKLAVGLTQRGRVQDAEKLVSALEAQGDTAKGRLPFVYDRVGNYYMNHRQVEEARPWYEKVISTSTAPDELMLAHYKVGVCDVLEHDYADGAAEMQIVLRSPKIPGDMKSVAEQMLLQLQAGPSFDGPPGSQDVSSPDPASPGPGSPSPTPPSPAPPNTTSSGPVLPNRAIPNTPAPTTPPRSARSAAASESTTTSGH